MDQTVVDQLPKDTFERIYNEWGSIQIAISDTDIEIHFDNDAAYDADEHAEDEEKWTWFYSGIVKMPLKRESFHEDLEQVKAVITTMQVYGHEKKLTGMNVQRLIIDFLRMADLEPDASDLDLPEDLQTEG
jgi:hypothetical protein